ncbi:MULTISPECIES: ATP-binding protein [Halomonadaceae]|uniref:ATP-binding protein n=1 Tax=Halomonadaceae TaxID=28256 RepID=UPI00159A652B|nr:MULTISPECIES: ATP-binding protein [Halomonas]QJQ94709.1 sensor histidine kinase [Halomonas sp. PA5]
MTSIRRYLIVSLALVLALATLSIVVSAYFITHHKMERILDAQLSMQGRIVSSLVGPGTSSEEYERLARHLDQPGHPAYWYGTSDAQAASPGRRYHPEERMLTLGFWQADGIPWLMGAEWGDAGAFPPPQREGYRWQEYDGQRWRVFSLQLDDHARWLSIGLRERFHDELSGEVALGNFLPMLVALPLLLAIVWLLVNRGLRPLSSLSQQVMGRGSQDLSHIDLAVPRELKVLRDALNDFITRLGVTLERERRFSADAAHELRTPLAALKIHLDNALAGERESLRKAYGGIERLQRVVEQLLLLARLDGPDAPPRETLDLLDMVQRLAAELWPLAEARGQVLEVDATVRPQIEGNATEVEILIRNLLDNALRYTPAGGRIEVVLGMGNVEEGEHAWLAIRDTGPGIAEELLAQVTERFRRVAGQEISGSGLGLSIALVLAYRQHARLALSNRADGGLEARLEWQ